jgi:hypothetical protein
MEGVEVTGVPNPARCHGGRFAPPVSTLLPVKTEARWSLGLAEIATVHDSVQPCSIEKGATRWLLGSTDELWI